MPTTHVRNIDTPWSPYAVTFSRDGSRLAMGGGSWYGHGGIILLDIERDRTRWLDWMDVPTVAARLRPGASTITSVPTAIPTVSCLCFSDDDRYLAASMWSSSQHYAPTMLFEVDGLTLRSREAFEYSGKATLTLNGETIADIERGTPTGVLLHHRHLITRQHRTNPDGQHVLVVDQLPSRLDLAAANRLQHLTHYRLVVVHDTVITEAGGCRSTGAFQRDGTFAAVPAAEGLALRDLQMPDAPLTVVPVHDCVRVTAIAALPGNDGFVTGGSSGQIDRWSWDGRWHQQRLRAAVTSKNARAKHADLRAARAENLPERIVAIVTLADSHDLVAVSAEGELLVLRSSGECESASIPLRGSPRSLAAHPHQPRVAVGMKQGDFGEPKSVVGLFDVR
jgi:hypothetical protein